MTVMFRDAAKIYEAIRAGEMSVSSFHMWLQAVEESSQVAPPKSPTAIELELAQGDSLTVRCKASR